MAPSGLDSSSEAWPRSCETSSVIMNVPPSNRCCVLYRFVTVARNRPLLPPPTLRQRSIGGSGTGLAHTFRAHTVSRIGELSRNLFHQDCMIPPGAVALDEVSCTIKGVGLGGVVTDTYSHVRMERADRLGPSSSTAHAARPTVDCRRRRLQTSEPPVSTRICRVHAARASKSEFATLFTGCKPSMLLRIPFAR